MHRLNLHSVEGAEGCWSPLRMAAVGVRARKLVLQEEANQCQEDTLALEWQPRPLVWLQERTAQRQARQEAAAGTWEGPHLGPSELGYAPQNFEPSHTDRRNLMA